MPMVAPIYLPGQEPMPAGTTQEQIDQMAQMQLWTKRASMAMESCPVKCAMSGAAGFALGGFFSLLSASFAIDDPLRRSNMMAANLTAGGAPQPELTTGQQTKLFFKETGKGMYRSAKGFGKVGALYSGIECVIEGYRAKNDIHNAIWGGFFAGAVLARNSGPKAMVGGGVAFAAFSGAIDMYFRRETPEEP
ncbi:mitochondrial import inner membrane translocase subunit tim22 [Ceraceosorus bombacis]|uniref:Mitochondrial import inner membrane translocase subunit TIM22 n=1 Tax=Ceraceosorus bombacis TaxID=401625 RepID=A0A0P1BPC2_9BASI|nr:mitochondrial import inner membrane translocase subunit tim22 [Ceraceosorus bombacis]